jgi:hypothetical protein
MRSHLARFWESKRTSWESEGEEGGMADDGFRSQAQVCTTTSHTEAPDSWARSESGVSVHWSLGRLTAYLPIARQQGGCWVLGAVSLKRHWHWYWHCRTSRISMFCDMGLAAPAMARLWPLATVVEPYRFVARSLRCGVLLIIQDVWMGASQCHNAAMIGGPLLQRAR